MRWTEVITEARDIPPTPYGYWIKPTGEFIVVPPYQHDPVLWRTARLQMDEAAAQGWVRVVYKKYHTSDNYSLSVQAEQGLMSARAFAGVAALAQNDQIDNFYADMGADAKSFGTREPFMAFVRQHRR